MSAPTDPLPRCRLGTGPVEISRLGFGGSRLHHLPGSAERQALLAAALDAGITHFDVAPIYGHGLAERELGRFVAGRRARVTIATKWGLPTERATDAVPLALMRHAANVAALRNKLRPPRRPPLDGAQVARSLEASLRRMAIDTIDVLWMHEPRIEDLPDPDALGDALQGLVARGLVRAFGVAGYGASIQRVLDALTPVAPLVQCDEADWPAGRVPDVTFGAISQGPQSRRQPAVAGSDAVARLRKALARRPDGAVLVSSTKPANLARLAEAAS